MSRSESNGDAQQSCAIVPRALSVLAAGAYDAALPAGTFGR